METFDRISIENISKNDLLVILDALQYSFDNSKVDEFQLLRNTIIKDLLVLTELEKETELIDYLKK